MLMSVFIINVIIIPDGRSKVINIYLCNNYRLTPSAGDLQEEQAGAAGAGVGGAQSVHQAQ